MEKRDIILIEPNDVVVISTKKRINDSEFQIILGEAQRAFCGHQVLLLNGAKLKLIRNAL